MAARRLGAPAIASPSPRTAVARRRAPARASVAGRAGRLVHHLRERHPVSRGGARHRGGPRAPRPHGGRSPRSRRAAGRCTPTRATATRRCRCSSASCACSATTTSTPWWRRRARAWRWSAITIVGWPTSPATRSSRRRPRRSRRACSSSRSSSSASSACTTSGAYFPHRVTYHPSCHALRMLGVGEAPLTLLRHVRGIELVELPEAESCCGFGGTFAIKNADTSAAMLADKMRAILDTGAEVCTALDCSCLLHIGGGLSRQRTGRAHRAPGRDPRRHRGSRDEPAVFPRPPARPCAIRSCATTCASPPTRSATSARRRWPSSRTGSSCARPGRRIKAPGDAPPRRAPRGARGVGHARGRESCTGRADAAEANRIVGRPGGGRGRARGGQGQVDRHRRDRPQRRAGGARASPRSRPIWPSSSTSSPATPRRTSSCPPSTATGPRSASCSQRTLPGAGRLERRSGGAGRGGARYLRRDVPRRAGGGQRRQLRRGRDRHGRASSSPRATGACARRCPAR